MVGIFVLFTQVVVSFPPKKNKLGAVFVSCPCTEGGSAVEEVCGEQDDMEQGQEYPELEKSEKWSFFLASKQL